MNETKPELQLMELIDLCGIWNAEDAWSGTATQLVSVLYGHEDYGSQARELVKSSNRCGIYLTRLVSEGHGRVTCQTRNNANFYTIRRPVETGTREDFSTLNVGDNNGSSGVNALAMARSGESVPVSPSRQTGQTHQTDRAFTQRCPNSPASRAGDRALAA